LEADSKTEGLGSDEAGHIRRTPMRQQSWALGLLVWMAVGSVATAEEYVFEGPWNTTNRKLDGVMTCQVTRLGEDQWQGRFYGVWFGESFDYTVPFSGPTDNLQGKARIGGANYTWRGLISDESPRVFKANFGGNRYEGYFNLKEKLRATAEPR
jgi:hypothetical protein